MLHPLGDTPDHRYLPDVHSPYAGDMVMKLLPRCLILLLLAACSDTAGPELADDDAIHVAFFAELITTAPSSSVAAYCISHGDWAQRQDPSEDVLDNLRDLFGKVQPGSACEYSAEATTYDGEPARAYHINSVDRTGRVADVTGFYRDNDANMTGYQGHLEKQGSNWVVVDFNPIGESPM